MEWTEENPLSRRIIGISIFFCCIYRHLCPVLWLIFFLFSFFSLFSSVLASGRTLCIVLVLMWRAREVCGAERRHQAAPVHLLLVRWPRMAAQPADWLEWLLLSLPHDANGNLCLCFGIAADICTIFLHLFFFICCSRFFRVCFHWSAQGKKFCRWNCMAV